MEIKLIWPDSVPVSQFDKEFLQGMLNRVAIGFYNYGLSRQNRGRVEWIRSLELRLAKYKETHNTEYLIDAANFAMIEFMYPNDPHAFFQATDKRGSPGVITQDGSTIRGKEDLG